MHDVLRLLLLAILAMISMPVDAADNSQSRRSAAASLR
jgi:hypothetical protein